VLPRLWKFFTNSKNREILSWLGGGVVVIATGIWVAIVYFFPPHEASGPASVQANCGGVAIGGNVTGTTITAGSDCSSKPKQGTVP
jgi:hypothetical protein